MTDSFGRYLDIPESITHVLSCALRIKKISDTATRKISRIGEKH